ncbi:MULTISPECIES: hypothetical protein [Streptomyces]|uniref:hypothetical protein n=1 Tax=Streptomyces TaxID=1883 RepID=UPI00035E0880|nr:MULTISPECIES: hypothetical protein [Streptomyces]MZD16798.1 hypothetical protein [Streptomyces sp. SID5476]
MLEVTRKGPVPYDGAALLWATPRGLDGPWGSARASLGHRWATDRGYADDYGPFPLDLSFVPSRVQEGNCRWAGLKGPKTTLGAPFRTFGHDSYDSGFPYEGDAVESWNFRCDECGSEFVGMNEDDAVHDIDPVVMKTGFGFDAQRRLFTASDEPGTLLVLLSSENRGIFGLLKPPRASFAYAREYGHMTGRKPVYEGQWSKSYNYAVLRSA